MEEEFRLKCFVFVARTLVGNIRVNSGRCKAVALLIMDWVATDYLRTITHHFTILHRQSCLGLESFWMNIQTPSISSRFHPFSVENVPEGIVVLLSKDDIFTDQKWWWPLFSSFWVTGGSLWSLLHQELLPALKLFIDTWEDAVHYYRNIRQYWYKRGGQVI